VPANPPCVWVINTKQQPAPQCASLVQGLRRRKEVASARATLELLQEVAHVASKVSGAAGTCTCLLLHELSVGIAATHGLALML
jgi:hypothetical protein